MTTIAAVRGVLPGPAYKQEDLTSTFAELCLPPERRSAALVERFHRSAQVATRHLALPLERYRELDGFTDANDAFLQVAVDLGAQAVTEALDAAGLAPADVDLIISTTVTGVAVPSLEARIAARIGLRPDVKRVPLMGLGCLAIMTILMSRSFKVNVLPIQPLRKSSLFWVKPRPQHPGSSKRTIMGTDTPDVLNPGI